MTGASLKEKLRDHYNLRKKEPFPPNFCNRITPFWYLSTILGSWFVSQTVVFPLLYENWSTILVAQRVISSIIFAEIMINWFCLRHVESVYNPGIFNKSPLRRPMLEKISSDAVTGESKEIDKEETYDGEYRAGDENEKRRGSSDNYTVYVATRLPHCETGLPERKPYPYWSWKPCLLCNHTRPPRCHHCPLCRACVLKRDHHCYFTGSCIGLNNQRHFIVFNFWSTIGTLYALAHALPFFYYDVIAEIMLADLFFPLALLRFLLGYIGLRCVSMITLLWSIGLFAGYSISFLYDQVLLLRLSQTSFEQQIGIKVCDRRDLSERITSVFGRNWLANFIVPMHWAYHPREDAIKWPSIKR